MRSVVKTLILFLALLLPAVSAQAQVLSVETYVEEWDRVQQKWVRIESGADRLSTGASTEIASTRTSATPHSFASDAIASFGPFRVIDQDHAALVGVTDRASPADFAAMLRDYPGLKTLKLIEAPGTDDDRANMKVARMIRAAGITTHVPNGGSVRSGAVELFLAGANRQIDDGAEFAVHSWIDAQGRQPQDFAMDAAPNRMYLEFYREMGMSDSEARAFYGMTNSVGFEDAKWLTAQEMRGWLGQEPQAHPEMKPAVNPEANPRIAYLDLTALLP